MKSHRLLIFGIVGAALIALSGTAYAFPPENLDQVLKRSTVGTRHRVPLLVIDAEGTRLSSDGTLRNKVYDLYPDDKAMPPLADALVGFNRQIVSCSTVQVVAPLRRVVLNPYPGPPEEWAQVGRERAARLLFGSLTAGQWSAASSEAGLGIDSLSRPEQKTWFRSLVPAPFNLRQVKQQGESGYTLSDADRRQTIAPEQVRIRVVRNMTWMYKSKGQNGGMYAFGSRANPRPDGELFWTEDTRAGQKPPETYFDKLKDAVRREEPNKLKKSDLGFNEPPLFGKRIALADAKTVGDLVQRVAEKTGLELYADRRLSGLKVTIVGAPDATADAADIMKALCYAFTGAIRKTVDENGKPLYLLTGDREGMMQTRLRLAEWSTDVDALLAVERDAFDTSTRDANRVKGVDFAPGSPRLPASVMARVEGDIVSPDLYKQGNFGYPRVGVSELTPDVRQAVAKDLADRATTGEEFDQQNIFAQFRVQVELVVPGYGTFSGPRLSDLDSLLKRPERRTTPDPSQTNSATPLPAGFHALKVAPRSDAEVDKATAWARKHGFRALFVRVSLWSDADKALLAHAVAQGKANGIAVYPAVSLMTAPPMDKVDVPAATKAVLSGLPRMSNMLGETLRQYAYRRKDSPMVARVLASADTLQSIRDNDWLDAESPAVREAVAHRLQEIAGTEGIAGMVIGDGAAPGYNIGAQSYVEGPMSGQNGGYNNALRAAMIRAENLDPIDVPPSDWMPPSIDTGSEGLTPYFPTAWDFRQRVQQSPVYRKDAQTSIWSVVPPANKPDYNDVVGWNALRREKNREWIGDIKKQASLPAQLSLYWEAPADLGNGVLTPWTQEWGAADTLPPLERGKTALLPVTIHKTMTPERVRLVLGPQLAQRMEQAKKTPYVGVLIDTTFSDMDKALSLLECLPKVP